MRFLLKVNIEDLARSGGSIDKAVKKYA